MIVSVCCLGDVWLGSGDVPQDEFWLVGDVDELDGESEWLDEPLLNWKTRDCDPVELTVLLRAVPIFGVLLLKPKKPFKLSDRCVLAPAPMGPGELVAEPLGLLFGLMARPVLPCRPEALEDTEAAFLANGPLSSSWAPGSAPNLGNSKEKLFTPLLVLSMELKPPASGGVRPSPLLFIDKRFRYSRSSIWSLCTCARNKPFSWLVASEAFSSSWTLVSRSLRCFSFRSLNAR